MNSKFVKGIMLMLAVLVTAFQGENVIWASTIITMVCVGAGYYVKNYFMPSNSVEGMLTLRDLISGLILAIVAAVGDSVAGLVVNGIVDWGAMYKMVIGVVVTYISTTFFTGAKIQAKV